MQTRNLAELYDLPHRRDRGDPDRGREPNVALPTAIETGGTAYQRLVPKLRREAVNFHLGVLVVGVRSDRAFNDLAYRRY